MTQLAAQLNPQAIALLNALTGGNTDPLAKPTPGASNAEDAAFKSKVAEKQKERDGILKKTAKKLAKVMYDALADIPVSISVFEIRSIGSTMQWTYFRTRNRLEYLDREMFKLEQQGVDPNGIDHADHLVDDNGSVSADRSTSLYARYRLEAERLENDLHWAELRLLAADIALGWANADHESLYGANLNGYVATFDSDISDAAYNTWVQRDQATRLERNRRARELTPITTRALRSTQVPPSITDFLNK